MKKEVLTSTFLDIRSKMHRIALRLLHDDEEAKDAVQDTFERVWSRTEVNSDEEARNKLVHVLRNTCIDNLRGRHTVVMDSAEIERSESYEMPTEDIAEYERLILTGLSDLQRRIYDMVTHECLEYDEISRRTGTSVEAVRMNMSRARKRIRENIKKLDR